MTPALNQSAFLDEIGNAVRNRQNLVPALAHILAYFRADSGTIHLLGPDNVLHLKASEGIPQAVRDLIKLVPVGKGMAGLAVERKRAVDSCNIQSDTSGDVRPGALQTNMRGAIVVPIFRGEDAVGALGIGNLHERTFTLEEIDLLVQTGRLIAGAQTPPEPEADAAIDP